MARPRLPIHRARMRQAVQMAGGQRDPVTGVANRKRLLELLEDATTELAAGGRFNLLVLDLDRFRSINDTQGHAGGDTLLVRTAERLLGVLNVGDVMARVGEDRFAILQQVIDNPKLEARKLAERVLATVSLRGRGKSLGVSIGITLAPLNGKKPIELIRKANLALRHAKASGGQFSFFQGERPVASQEQHALERDLRSAIANAELELYYQPIVGITSKAVCGYEALVRWHHPQLGMVGPDQFIPLAEKTGLIVPLGEWILRRACNDAATWPNTYRLAVNLSPIQLGDAGLIDAVDRAVKESGLPVHRLELEVTETAVLASADSFTRLAALQARGIGIVLDDFGTGYASLENLVMFPFNKIKIDRNFVAGLPNQRGCWAIISAIVGLGRELNMDVTAEGVETAAQLAILAVAGCNNVQGYYFARPLPLSEIDLILGLGAAEAR